MSSNSITTRVELRVSILWIILLGLFTVQPGLAESMKCEDMPCCATKAHIDQCCEMTESMAESAACHCQLNERTPAPTETRSQIPSQQNFELETSLALVLNLSQERPAPLLLQTGRGNHIGPNRDQDFNSYSSFPNPPPATE